MDWLNVRFQVFLSLKTYATLFTIKQFESIMDWLNMCFQVFFSLITYTTLFTIKQFESIMKWVIVKNVAYVFRLNMI